MAINFSSGELNEYLADLAGYKVGLALTLEELYDHLNGVEGYADIARQSEQNGIRLHSTEVESITYRLMHRVGYTEQEYDGDDTGAWRYHKYRKSGQLELYQRVCTLWIEMMPSMMEAAQKCAGGIDPSPYLERCAKAFGHTGLDMAVEQIKVLDMALRMSIISTSQGEVWGDRVTLAQLFQGAQHIAKEGAFIDQRFIDYLSVNKDRIPEMHWRRFEELTAEFFQREGFKVELGPGANDDGVDVRVWKSDSGPGATPLCLIQCKRQKAKVEKVVIKGLLADVQWEQAEYGVIVTSSTLSPGAKTTIEARGYPIRAVERDAVSRWFEQLRTPGTGIIRI
ncbi:MULTISPECIES: restriction endonuclease [unclassified Pseudomonas]|uniref:restriction endonuclease n=1 Tax=unclassified Pseudomonas TaxID=196821 RepID=UPI00119FE128|nr:MULTISPECIES: restriction endonuclease [unclassified Pseudomonas]TWC12499.1 restriction system protein [Pseudomonas sp. SJZ075]TWC28945.1 restriction system protein [Pseudomonas sp. SJZ078]TWC49479.1 restriction system protein [Pseudomonas sp. SJZ124]TWC84657.1 restriction system protein [Pseudomonas sp. SJZ101]